MNKEELKNIVADVFGNSSEVVFNLFIKKIASLIKGNQALLLNSIGHFQIKKEPISRMERIEGGSGGEKDIVLFLPAGEINQDKIIVLEIDDSIKISSEFNDSIFDLGFNESNIIVEPENDTLEEGSEIVDESLQNNIIEFVGSGEIIEGYQLFNENPPNSIPDINDDAKENDEIIADDNLSMGGDYNINGVGINEELPSEDEISDIDEIVSDDNLSMGGDYNINGVGINEELPSEDEISDIDEIVSDDNLSMGGDYNINGVGITEELPNEDEIGKDDEIVFDDHLDKGSDYDLTGGAINEELPSEDEINDVDEIVFDDHLGKGSDYDLTDGGINEELPNEDVISDVDEIIHDDILNKDVESTDTEREMGDDLIEENLPFNNIYDDDDYDVTSSRYEPEITIDDVNESRSGITKAESEIDEEAKLDAEIEAKIQAELEKKIAAKNRAELVAKLAAKNKSNLGTKVELEKKAELEAKKKAELEAKKISEKKAEVDARIEAAKKKAALDAEIVAEEKEVHDANIESELVTEFEAMIEEEQKEELETKSDSDNISGFENELELKTEDSELNADESNPFDELDDSIKDEKMENTLEIMDVESEIETSDSIDLELQSDYPSISYSEFNQKTNKWYKNPILYITTFGLVVGILVVYFFFPLSNLLKVEDRSNRFVIDSQDIKGVIDSTSSNDSKDNTTTPIETSDDKIEDTVKTVPVKKYVRPKVTTLTGLYRDIVNDKSITKMIYFDGKRYTIQASSWRSTSIAEREVLKLKKRGFDAFIYKAFITSKNATWNRVRIGYFKSQKEAEDFLKNNRI